MKPTLVTSYVNPDIDGVSCMIAYSEYLNKKGLESVSAILGVAQDEAKYIFRRFNIPEPRNLKSANDFDKIILVDSSQVSALDNLVEVSKVTEIVDHRQLNDSHVFKNAKIQIELVGAAATLIAEKFMEAKMNISKESAVLLYAAIVSNTVNFKASVTTSRDRQAAIWLNKIVNLPKSFPYEMFLAKSDVSGKILERRMVDDFATIEFQGKKRGIAQIEMVGATDLVKNREQEILQILNKLKQDESLDYFFLSLVDLDEGANIFVTSDRPTKALLEKTFGIHFRGNIAELRPFLMRKQIGPTINNMLEGK